MAISDYSEEAISMPGGAPLAPIGVAAQSTSAESIQVTWQISAEDDLLAYKIYRSLDESQGFSVVGSNPVKTTLFVDGGLSTGTPYYYAVTAVDFDGVEGPFSGVVSAIPQVVIFEDEIFLDGFENKDK